MTIDGTLPVSSGPAPALDPELEPLVTAFPDFAIGEDNLATFRATVEAPPLEPSPGVLSADHVIDADTGVVVRVHRPEGRDALRPCVYSIHGGGFVIGGRWMDDQRLARWCREFACVGVSVEYRLAPEHAYPTPLEDCYAGLAWVFANAETLGVDPTRVGITGLSAGGGLAAGLALLARDRGEYALQFQVLESAMLDDRTKTPSSRLDGLAIWNRHSNAFGWRSYLGGLAEGAVPSYAAPARADDLHGLPPTFVNVGSADGFRDEDVEYATRLNQAGVPTEVRVYAGAPHGFEMFEHTRVAHQAAADLDAWIARHLTS